VDKLITIFQSVLTLVSDIVRSASYMNQGSIIPAEAIRLGINVANDLPSEEFERAESRCGEEADVPIAFGCFPRFPMLELS
jgi:hypothetical protein